MIIFKTATIEDTKELAKLVNSAYRGEDSKKGWTTEADLLDGQRTDEKSLNYLICTTLNQIEMAIENGQLIGSVHLKQEDEKTLYFGMLTVAPQLQAKGIGKILLNHIEKIAHQKGLSRIRITVIPFRKELIAFYERRGFKATGRVEAFPESDPLFGVPKVQGLSLHEFEKNL